MRTISSFIDLCQQRLYCNPWQYRMHCLRCSTVQQSSLTKDTTFLELNGSTCTQFVFCQILPVSPDHTRVETESMHMLRVSGF